MSNASYNGAIVLIALLPILPLAMYLRRRNGAKRPRGTLVAGAASLVLLVVGTGFAIGSGVF